MDNIQYVEKSIKDYECFKKELKNKKEENEELISVSMPAAFDKAVQTGRALNNEHIKLYKSLDPDHLNGGPNQKHGCAAERQQVHDRNVEKIKNGQEPNTRLSDSGIDPKVDIIDGSTNYQMKFCATAQETYNAFLKGDYEGVKKYCPKNQAKDIKKIAKQQAKNYREKANECKKNGDEKSYEENMAKAKKAQDIADTIEDSSVTYDQSKTIVPDKTKNAILSVSRDCHRAGIEGAKSGAIISGIFSGGENLIAVFKGEKEFTNAVIDTIKTTAVSAAKSYATSAGATLLATGAQQASIALGNVAQTATNSAVAAAASNVSSVMHSFSSSAAPAMVIVGAVEFTKSVYKYSQGEMTKSELMVDLGRKTAGIVTSTIAGKAASVAATALFAPLGPAAPILGMIVGAATSMLVYSITNAFYDSIVESIRLAKRREEVARLTVMYQEAYEQLCQSRSELLQFLSQQKQLRSHITIDSLRNMETAIFDGDLMKFNSNLGRILDIYADGLLFKDKKEFDTAMHSDLVIKI